MAAELENDPNALFMEVPKCPDCSESVDPVEAGPNSQGMPSTPTPKNRCLGILCMIVSGFGGYALWDNDHGFWAVAVVLVFGGGGLQMTLTNRRDSSP